MVEVRSFSLGRESERFGSVSSQSGNRIEMIRNHPVGMVFLDSSCDSSLEPSLVFLLFERVKVLVCLNGQVGEEWWMPSAEVLRVSDLTGIGIETTHICSSTV